jgi:hypothetical protein
MRIGNTIVSEGTIRKLKSDLSKKYHKKLLEKINEDKLNQRG